MKTKEEINELKSSWLKDDCWDIEDTPGFEEHRQELYIFSLEVRLNRIQRDFDKYYDRHEAFKIVCKEIFGGNK